MTGPQFQNGYDSGQVVCFFLQSWQQVLQLIKMIFIF